MAEHTCMHTNPTRQQLPTRSLLLVRDSPRSRKFPHDNPRAKC
jgi:hypothetical protein